MPAWFWMNIPLGAVLYSAMVGIPLWMVFRRPDTGEEIAQATARVRTMPLATVSKIEADRWRNAA